MNNKSFKQLLLALMYNDGYRYLARDPVYGRLHAFKSKPWIKGYEYWVSSDGTMLISHPFDIFDEIDRVCSEPTLIKYILNYKFLEVIQ